MEFLRELADRAELGSWDSWSTQQRVLAVVVGLLVAYVALWIMLPAVLRLLRPVLFLAIALVALWAFFPTETCSIELLSRLPVLCAR